MTNINSGQTQNQASTQKIVNSYQSSTAQSATSATSQPGSAASQGAGSAASQSGTRTVIGVFQSRSSAEQAVNQLRQQGFSMEEINIVSKKDQNKDSQFVDDDISDGALTGGTIGGIGGLLVGAGALAIPGIGPIIAAGPIAAALSGAVAGGIAGGLIDWGIPAEVSRQYEKEVAEGGTLAVIRTTSQKVDQAAQILRKNGAKDVESHS